MLRRSGTITTTILEFLYSAINPRPRPLLAPFAHLKKNRQIDYKDYYQAVTEATRRGLVELTEKDGEKFIGLTEDGELELLLLKACEVEPMKWDGKWRLIIFDIPESQRSRRNILRMLLYKNGFHKLQASVFISPRALNREALRYLEQSGLSQYVRVARIDEMDNDADLRKYFKMKKA